MPLKSLLALFAVVLLAGCKLKIPTADSGSVELHQGVRVTRGDLSDFQVNALSAWLRAHKTGWKYRIEDTAPALLVYLRHKGTLVGVVNVGPREINVGSHFRALTPDERIALQRILEPPQT